MYTLRLVVLISLTQLTIPSLAFALSTSDWEKQEYAKLPSKIRKHVEETRASCKRINEAMQIHFLLLGITKVDLEGDGDFDYIVDDRKLCDGVYMGGNCGNRAGCDLTVYKRTPSGGYKIALRVLKYSHYTAYDNRGDAGRFMFLVLEIDAWEPQCQPDSGREFGRYDHCWVVATYQKGRWQWMKANKLSKVIRGIGNVYNLKLR